ncbi:MAG TPA: YdbH domain-containing protein [Opitutaceae bacterium]|nr:YdbH domain-containing protein [Opitutaceae bacterium]
MTAPRSRLRLWLKLGAALAVVVVAALVLARRQLVETAVGAVLRLAGASEVKLSVAQASPWRVVLDDVAFSVRTQPFAAGRVTFERAHWWTPSVGHVRIERAYFPFHADGSDTNPWAWATYPGGPSKDPPALPAEKLSVDGTLAIKASALPDQDVEIRLEAEWAEGEEWKGRVTGKGRGLDVAARASFWPSSGDVAFQVSEARVDLAAWQDFVHRLVILPGGRWEAAGILVATVDGRRSGGRTDVGGTVRLEGGSLANAERKIAATGIECEISFRDFDRVQSEGGKLKVAELRVGEFPVNDLDVAFDFASANQVAIRAARARALGGVVSTAEPFNVFLDQQDLEIVVRAEGLALEQILALAKNVPAQATGRVDGRVPLQFGRNGVRFGTGWLALKEGTTAELQLNAAGLLTRGTDARSPAFAVLQKVESGLLRLRVGTLRLDIYPPNRPPGRSATVRVAGEPIDPSVKAPVTLDLNVNGPIERLINLGLDSRVKVGGERP